jgi:hypothetical protein
VLHSATRAAATRRVQPTTATTPTNA